MRSLGMLALGFALVACSGPQPAQDGGDLTRSEVEYLQSRMAEAVEREYPVLRHRLVNRYVTSLGQSLVSRNRDMPPLPYEFRVLRSEDVLAFSLPGGMVYVSLGLLRLCETEGHFAAALAHELAHQQLGHSLAQWRRKVNRNRGERYILNFDGPWRANFLGEAGALWLGKGPEEEADKLGPVILYRGGIDPRLYGAYLQLLKKMETAQPARIAILAGLHPPLAERMAWAKQATLSLPPLKDADVSSQTFRQIKSILHEAAKRGGEKERKQ